MKNLGFLLKYGDKEIFGSQTNLLVYLNKIEEGRYNHSYLNRIINGKRSLTEVYKNAFKAALDLLENEGKIYDEEKLKISKLIDEAFLNKGKILTLSNQIDSPLVLATSYSEYAIPVFHLKEELEKMDDDEELMELYSFINKKTDTLHTPNEDKDAIRLSAPLIFELLKDEKIHGAFLLHEAFQENMRKPEFTGLPFAPIARVSISNGNIPVVIAHKLKIANYEKRNDTTNDILHWINNEVFNNSEFPLLYIQGTISEVLYDKFFQDGKNFPKQKPICIKEYDKENIFNYLEKFDGFILIGWDAYIQEIESVLNTDDDFKFVISTNLKEYSPFIEKYYLQSFDFVFNANYFAKHYFKIEKLLKVLQTVASDLSSKKMNNQLEQYFGTLIKGKDKNIAFDTFYDNSKFEILTYLKYQEWFIKGIKNNEIKLK